MSSEISAWEQHGQSIITSVVLVILVWVGYNVNENSKSSAVVAVEISGLKLQVSELKTVVNNDVRRIGNEQATRGPRITANETAIREIFSLIHEYHNNKRSRK